MKSEFEPLIPNVSQVADFAIRLHEERQLKLRVDLASNPRLAEIDLPSGCKLVDGSLEFGTLEVRNRVVAAAIHERFFRIEEIDGDDLFTRAFELWRKEIGCNDQASGRLLALASGRIDVLTKGAQRIRSGFDVFDVLHLIEAALPYLDNIAAPSIIDLVSAKHEPTKNDMAAGTINGAIERWLEKRPDLAVEVHDKVLEGLSEANASLLGNAIVALSRSDYMAGVEVAITDARSNLLMQAQVGTWTLGRLLLDDRAPQEAMSIVVNNVIDLMRSEIADIKRQAITAAVGAMHATAVFDDLLLSRAENGDQDVLCASASALFFKGEEICRRGMTQCWLQLVTALKPEFGGAIRHFDYALSRLLSNSNDAEIVLATLGQWVANHGQHIPRDTSIGELFKSTFQALSAIEKSWSQLITDWLLSDQQSHVSALAEVLNQFSHRSASSLTLNKSRLDGLPINDLLLLARRILGYVHDREQMTSLALSMLQTNDAERRVYPLLISLLVEEIGYDYPKTTIDALNRAAQGMVLESERDFVRAMANALNQILEAQNALPFINELRPPTRLRRLFSRARSKQMEKSLEEANKNSIIRQVATEIPLKAGAGTFNYREFNYGPSTRLSTVSHSIELPRREAFDPIGNSIRHLGFRIANREDS